MTRENAADILCIGAQRSMTSWLHQALAPHPETWAFPPFDPVTSSNKEAHYWDWNHRRGPDWYRVLMRPLDERLKSLDVTPEYAFLTREQIDECKALNPTARVIYILRDPLARSLSALRMHTLWASGHASESEVQLHYDKGFLAKAHNAKLVEHADYARNLRRWRRAYPDLLVLNYEDLARDPLAGYRRILDHCGLAWDNLDEQTREHLSERARRHVWATPRYAINADGLHFLDGVTAPLRRSLEEETGLTFTEGAALMDGLT